MNSLRSAISAYHVHIDGKSVEKQPKVFALLAGIFNQRPPQPRYVVIWDVEIVLQYIRTAGMTIHHLMMQTLVVNSQLS